jgi:hypothetical protein
VSNRVAELRDRLKCNQPVKQESGGKKFVVKACTEGSEKIVRFGDASMGHFKEGESKGKGHGDSGRRANFRARHNCDQKTDKTTAGYWSCRHSW